MVVLTTRESGMFTGVRLGMGTYDGGWDLGFIHI